MNYDGLILAAVIAELNGTIRGARVQKVRQHNDTDVTLEIRGVGHTYLLFLSVDPRFPRVYLTASSNPVPQEAPNFCMVLRKYVQGALISSVEQAGFDRILKMRLESSEHGKCSLILEIMGKHSNLVLTDDEGKILGAAKHVGATISRYRQILPGREYLPPPGGDKLDLRSADPALLRVLWSNSLQENDAPASVRDWLMSTFSGVGPFLADEITARSTGDGHVSQEKVFAELAGLREMVRTSAYMPVFVTGERGEGLMVYPMPSVQRPSSLQHPRVSVNEALDTLFRTLVTRTLADDERVQTLTAIRRAQAARKQTLKSIERTLLESEKADSYRQIGELILASLHLMEKGAKSVRLVNYFDPDMPEVDVELDEKQTPQRNAERYFKRYQKARDAVSSAESRRENVLREVRELEAAKSDAESATTVESLKSLRKMLTERDLLRQEIVHEKQAEEFAGFRIRRFHTPEGWEILYGENSTSNDHLTQRVARPNDVWLHARSITGAHVVIRTAGHSGDVPRPVLSRAAKIAAQNSDAKHSSLVPIDHTLRKYVRKPRGSAPGFVTYRNEKTIDINPKE